MAEIGEINSKEVSGIVFGFCRHVCHPQEIQEYNKQLIEIYQQFAYSVAVTRRFGASACGGFSMGKSVNGNDLGKF